MQWKQQMSLRNYLALGGKLSALNVDNTILRTHVNTQESIIEIVPTGQENELGLPTYTVTNENNVTSVVSNAYIDVYVEMHLDESYKK